MNITIIYLSFTLSFPQEKIKEKRGGELHHGSKEKEEEEEIIGSCRQEAT